jgi:peptidoglycan/LPS O-acetylase OafA/YrhL
VTRPLSTPVAGPANHLPALDGVRGLAILMVLVYHLMLFNNNSGNRWMDTLAQLRDLGGTGVDLFFVLSGFLITGILYDTLHQPYFFRNFYMRRFLRIFPLYYGFLFLLLVLTPWLHVLWGGRQFVLLAYLQNTAVWFPVDGFHPADLVDLNHFWSLAVEEQFYLVWPLLVFLVKDRRRLIQLSLFLSACALGLRIFLSTHGTALASGVVHEWTLCRMDTLMFGGCLALWLRGHPVQVARPILRRWATGWLGASFLMMVGIAVGRPHGEINSIPFVATYGYTILAIAFAALIFLAMQPGPGWNKFFRMTWLRSLGKYSYGIYVLHILVGYLWGMAMRVLLGTSLRIWLTPRLHSRPLAILVEFFLVACVVYAAAWLSYNLYEVHFLRFKKFFPSRPHSRNPTALGTAQTVSF